MAREKDILFFAVLLKTAQQQLVLAVGLLSQFMLAGCKVLRCAILDPGAVEVFVLRLRDKLFAQRFRVRKMDEPGALPWHLGIPIDREHLSGMMPNAIPG